MSFDPVTRSISVYATVSDLEDFLGVLPADAERLLKRASELIYAKTFFRAEDAWHEVDEDNPADIYTDNLRDAVCAQVEYWQETGESFAIVAPKQAAEAGKLKVPALPELAPRARDFLQRTGLLYAGADFTYLPGSPSRSV